MRARNGALLVGIDGMQDLPRLRVNEHGACGVNARRAVWFERGGLRGG